ncbi:hypothetical protein Pan258_11520 [Symmachiella dynata]|uniref:Uncharacterized protein n=1 Tax=Symmachiella dynata TaxID=2527995 RepID=A0A517ZJM3_9PLAN|nr:hypothetical protein Pan258_11520 [Symmachiella dynata]QDU42633.1 hypothetical protein Mal52_11000 [Symmachiella dynata]
MAESHHAGLCQFFLSAMSSFTRDAWSELCAPRLRFDMLPIIPGVVDEW